MTPEQKKIEEAAVKAAAEAQRQAEERAEAERKKVERDALAFSAELSRRKRPNTTNSGGPNREAEDDD